MKDINNDEVLRGDLILLISGSNNDLFSQTVVFYNNDSAQGTIQYYPLTNEGLEVCLSDMGINLPLLHRTADYVAYGVGSPNVTRRDGGLLRGANKPLFNSIVTALSAGQLYGPTTITDISNPASPVSRYPGDTYTCGVQAGADATVNNSDATFTDTVAAGGTLVLNDEDIQIQDHNGTVLGNLTNPLYSNITIDLNNY